MSLRIMKQRPEAEEDGILDLNQSKSTKITFMYLLKLNVLMR